MLLNTRCTHPSVNGRKGNIRKQVLFMIKVMVKRAEEGMQ